MFSLCLSNRHLSKIKELNYIPVGLGNDNFSKEWVRRRVLKQTDLDIAVIDKQIANEKKTGEIDSKAGLGLGGPEGGFGDPSRGVEQDPYDAYDDMAPEV